jgi:hypothetical protein
MNARAARSRRAARMAKAVSKFAPPDPESALWSAFGYDTVCLFWGLPVRVFGALSEAERQGMVRVSNRIDDMSATEKEPLLREIGRATPTKRLAIFRRLARALAGGRPIVAKARVSSRRVRSSA